jgi:hypothetical protein
MPYFYATCLWLSIFAMAPAGTSMHVDSRVTATHDNRTNQAHMTISVQGSHFKVSLQDNATTRALLQMLPLTLSMEDLHANEKFHFLSLDLPAAESSVGQIEAGDIMLYGKNCLVIFYASFKTSYRYTRIGKVDQPSKLAAALGKGTVQVVWGR